MEKSQRPKKTVFVKRFNAWNKLKIKLNRQTDVVTRYKERDIWWVSIGHNVGTEEDGKGETFNRPVLIVKGFSQFMFWGVPLSTTTKEGKYYHKFVANGKVSTALLSQLRVYDTRRFINKYGMASKRDLDIIKQKLRDFLQ